MASSVQMSLSPVMMSDQIFKAYIIQNYRCLFVTFPVFLVRDFVGLFIILKTDFSK